MSDNVNVQFISALTSANKSEALNLLEKYNLNTIQEIEKIVTESLITIGDEWEKGHFSLAQVFMSGLICEELIRDNSNIEVETEDQYPAIGIGTLVDHHSLGKRMVTSILKIAGVELVDFGSGLSVEEFADKVLESKVEIVIISVLMYPSALEIKNLISMLDERGVKAKFIVGGAPFRFDPTLWKAVGADADGKNASDIIQVIKSLLEVEYE